MKKLGLVLGGGGALGFAHIGFLKKLEEYNIKPHLVVGCSMGALIGALYSLGFSLDYIEKIAYNFKYSLLLDFSKKQKMGILDGNRAYDFFEIITAKKKFSDCKIPFYLNTADFFTEKEHVIYKGYLADAIRASTSIPWIFKPVKRGKKLLVDGGVADPLPVELAKLKGADFTIAVGFSQCINNEDLKLEYEHIKNLSISPGQYFVEQLSQNLVLSKLFKKLKSKKSNSFSSIYLNIVNLMSILTISKIKKSEDLSDIYVNPNLNKYSPLSFSQAEDIIKIGYLEAEKRIDEIVEKLKKEKFL